ncbi:hypothetical protein ACFL20_10485, partial [Spirochaetota bacterium]
MDGLSTKIIFPDIIENKKELLQGKIINIDNTKATIEMLTPYNETQIVAVSRKAYEEKKYLVNREANAITKEGLEFSNILLYIMYEIIISFKSNSEKIRSEYEVFK